jgi:hypothetical protein
MPWYVVEIVTAHAEKVFAFLVHCPAEKQSKMVPQKKNGRRSRRLCESTSVRIFLVPLVWVGRLRLARAATALDDLQ